MDYISKMNSAENNLLFCVSDYFGVTRLQGKEGRIRVRTNAATRDS